MHTSTDCIMKYSDFEHLCGQIGYPGSANLLKLQLLEDKKIARAVTPDGVEVR